jgi:cellulose synthase/poly-beta-1,6-N-acetylglucosamine synthase-like glycosyltransferase
MNEADNVLPLVKRIRDAVARNKVEVLFVDDSKDTLTVQKVREADHKYGTKTFRADIYHRVGEQNWGGLSGAVADGMIRAGSNRIVVMDGDLQHPPELLPDMIEASRHYDMVVTSRYRKGGSASGLKSGIRHLVSRGSTIVSRMFFPIRLRNVTDPMTGFFLVDRRKIDSKKLHPQGFKILLEILGTHPELTVTEVPMKFAERVNGDSHGDLKQGLKFIDQLISLRFGQKFSISSIPKFVWFGLIGGSVFVLGMVLLYALVEKLGMSPLAANAIQLAFTFWLNYVLNRRVTWRERSVSRRAASKFFFSRAATTVLNYLMFAWLIHFDQSLTIMGNAIEVSVNYIVANVITLFAIMILNYYISDRWAFAEPKAKPARAKATRRARGRVPASLYLALIILAIIDFGLGFNAILTISILLAAAGLILFLQSSMEAWRVMYAYRDPESVDRLKFPEPKKPKERFAIIVPARHESAVLASTLHRLARQTHPNVDIFAVICDDDDDTLKVAYEVDKVEPHVGVIEYPLAPGSKPRKPKQLNYAFNLIKDEGYTVIGIVDAEDEVNPELLVHIDTAFRERGVGLVQGGVQLMNHDSSWYSLHNVLEYYRWFNSAMSFQADNKFMPLGGNTIFIRTGLLSKAGGWPDTLTEDCSLGVLISTRFKTKQAVYYEPHLATQEETPDSLKGLFKQRVRWNQGFFHEWRKGIWRDLPSFRQRLLASYVLLSPVLLTAISIFIPISLLAVVFLSAPVGLVMLMYLPLVPAMLQMVLNAVFLHDFGKAYERKILIRQYVMLIVTHFLYQIVLNTAAFWAIIRELRGDQSWAKTEHTGQHRRVEPVYAMGAEESGNA